MVSKADCKESFIALMKFHKGLVDVNNFKMVSIKLSYPIKLPDFALIDQF